MCVFLCSFISLVLHLALHNIINFWHLDDVALLKKWGFLILVLFFSDLFLFNLHISSYSSKVVLSFFWYACSCDCVLFMCVCLFFSYVGGLQLLHFSEFFFIYFSLWLLIGCSSYRNLLCFTGNCFCFVLFLICFCFFLCYFSSS